MKRTLMTTAAIYAALCIGANAQAATKYFWHDEDEPQPWSDTDCWYPNPGGTGTHPPTLPDCDDHVVIEADCYLDIDGFCGSFEVASNINLYLEDITQGPTGYTLTVCSNGISTVHSGAIVHLQDDTSELKFSADPTLTGEGKVQGSDDSAKITIDSGETLYNWTTIEGCLQIVGDGSFTNCGTVDANDNCTLKIAVGGTVDDCASAYWKATANGAILNFDSTIGTIASLEGDFVIETSAGAEIEVNHALSGTGGFYMDVNGTLDVNEDMVLGSLMRSMYMSAGRIEVAPGKTFLHY